MSKYVDRVLAELKEKNAHEAEFLQTAEEVLSTLGPVVDAHPEYEKVALLERMVEPDSGEYLLEGKNVYASRDGKKNLQNMLSVVFQDYTTSANPRFRIRDILAEGIRVKERKNGKKTDRSAEYCRLLELVGLDETFLDRFPHELSGGQLQRVCIARAVACEPEFILFDEAISSLDAHTQVQVMDLLKELKEKLGLTYVFITHDLTSVTYLCDEVMFLYKGRITEHIPVSRIAQTTDVYARKLLDSIIEFDEEYDDEMDVKESEESA